MGDGAYWFEELKEPFMDLDSYEYLPEIVNRRALALCFAAELVRTGSYPFKKRKRKRKRK